VSRQNDKTIPDLPPQIRGVATAFHVYCEAELERRQAEPGFHEQRFARAVRIVLGRLGVDVGEQRR